MQPFSKSVIDQLINGKVGIIPTDTIYGVVGRCDLKETVERIYTVRKRNLNKPCIILISSYKDLDIFEIEIEAKIQRYIETEKIWPGNVSIVLPFHNPNFSHLTRGGESLAFRMPAVPELCALIAQTGPIIATSANIEGAPHAHTITRAKEYFGDSVDFYVDGGVCDGNPSRILSLLGDSPEVIR